MTTYNWFNLTQTNLGAGTTTERFDEFADEHESMPLNGHASFVHSFMPLNGLALGDSAADAINGDAGNNYIGFDIYTSIGNGSLPLSRYQLPTANALQAFEIFNLGADADIINPTTNGDLPLLLATAASTDEE